MTEYLIYVASLCLGFFIGWSARTIRFTKEKDCANPAHQDWDYRKER